MWTGEFDLNTLRVDGEIFDFGKKKLRIQKYPDTYGRGLSVVCTLIDNDTRQHGGQNGVDSRGAVYCHGNKNCKLLLLTVKKQTFVIQID